MKYGSLGNQLPSNVMCETEIPYVIYCMCCIQNVIMQCSIYEIQSLFESYVTWI